MLFELSAPYFILSEATELRFQFFRLSTSNPISSDLSISRFQALHNQSHKNAAKFTFHHVFLTSSRFLPHTPNFLSSPLSVEQFRQLGMRLWRSPLICSLFLHLTLLRVYMRQAPTSFSSVFLPPSRQLELHDKGSTDCLAAL